MYSRIWNSFVSRSLSSLALRIIFLNVVGLLALLIGVLHVARFRAVLIDARVQSLLLQGEIIAGAIAASAATDSDAVIIDRQRPLELQPGESDDPTQASLSGRDLPIDPERAAALLRRLVAPTNLRARLYDRDGRLSLDSRNFYDVLRFDLPPTAAEEPGLLMRAVGGAVVSSCRNYREAGAAAAAGGRFAACLAIGLRCQGRGAGVPGACGMGRQRGDAQSGDEHSHRQGARYSC
jgi:two-component system sensor histidine kinase ChvG